MKRKFGIFINVMLMVLCISSIAFGVYSAQKAQLNITGNFGFTAHNAFVSVTGFVKNVAQIENDNVVGKTDIAIDKIVKGADTTDPVNITMPLGDMYFYSNNNNVSAEDIVFELTFTNLGATDIIATITKPSLSSTVTVIDNSDGNHSSYISFGENNQYSKLIIQGRDITIRFALHLNDKSTLSSKIAFNMPINFEEMFKDGNNFFWNKTSTNTRTYVNMGQVSSTDATPLRWYIFAKRDSNGTMQAVESSVLNENGTLDAGTYWFISEYVLDCDTANGNYSIMFDDSSNIYGNSDIKAYLDGTGSGSFIKTHGITTTDLVYSQITARTLPAEVASGDVGAFTAVADQKLWLLSVSELACLNNNEPATIFDENGNSNLIANNNSGAASNWWLRSSPTDIPSIAFIVASTSDGFVGGIGVASDGGVRPAFQITIS